MGDVDVLRNLFDATRILPGYILLVAVYYAAVAYPILWVLRRKRR